MLAHFRENDTKSQVFIYIFFRRLQFGELKRERNLLESIRHIICIAFIYGRTRTTFLFRWFAYSELYALLAYLEQLFFLCSLQNETDTLTPTSSIGRSLEHIFNNSTYRVRSTCRVYMMWSISVNRTRIPYQFLPCFMMNAKLYTE